MPLRWTYRGAGQVIRQVLPVCPAVLGDRLYTFDQVWPHDSDVDAFAPDQPVSAGEPVCWLVELSAATGGWVRSVALPPGLVSSCDAPVVHRGVLWFAACRLTGTFDDTPTGGVLCRVDPAAGRTEVVAGLADRPCGAPAVDGDVLYQATTSGVLQAFDTATGREVWRWTAGPVLQTDSFGQERPHAAGDGAVFALTATGLAALIPPR